MQRKDLNNTTRPDETPPPDAAGATTVKPVAFEPRGAKSSPGKVRRGRLWLVALGLPAVV